MIKNNLITKGNDLVQVGQDSFDPYHIFECGQAFNWKLEDDGSYTFVAYNRVVNVSLQDENIIFKNTNLKDFEKYWIDYFDLETDYSKIKSLVNIDDTMDQAIEYGSGIRILNQEPFETIISFIISANNRIPMIKRSVKLLSENYGQYIGEYNGESYYSFPTPEKLATIDPSEIRESSRVGFRDVRIVKTAQIITQGDLNMESLYNLDREESKKVLMELPGVGPKVSDCIMLFAYGKKDTFPVDVWIKRIMETLYLDSAEIKPSQVDELGRQMYGQYAGVAQQYLFFYGRDHSIGKN